MPEDLPPERHRGRPDQGTETVRYLDQALWRQLVDATTVDQFCRSWLDLQSRMVEGVSAGLVALRQPDSATLSPVALHPEGSREGQHLLGAIERALEEGKGVAVRSDADGDPEPAEELRLHLAYPVRIGEEIHAVAALRITPRPQVQLQIAMRQIQWGAAWLRVWILDRGARRLEPHDDRLETTLELTALTLEEDRFRDAATAFVTELATRLECDRVSVGFMEGKQVKVRALSHSAEFGKEMNLIRSIGVAMSESIDQQATLVYPELDGAAHDVLRAHEQLARTHGDGAVCTVPFVDREGMAFGAVTLERSTHIPFDERTRALCDATAALVGPILEEKRRNDRLLIRKIGDSLWSQVKKLVGPRHAVRKLVAGAALVLVLFFSFADGRFRVTAETTPEGEIQRVVAAPYQGFIFEAPVRAGDIVREGQVMCRLDERDLRLEHSKWSSERQQYELERRKAMAERDLAAMQVLGKKIRQAEAQLARLDEELARAAIVAPFDGLVVSGDLSQSLGSPVETGDVLFEVAPLDAYRVMLSVDERDIGHLAEGQQGELILTAMPGAKLEFTITRITPVSVTEEGQNRFVVEARLTEISEDLRPGMEGYGKVVVGRRKLIWIWTHPLTDWVRLRAWSWWP